MNATPKPLPALDDLFDRDWRLPATPEPMTAEQYQRDAIADAQTDDDEPEDLGCRTSPQHWSRRSGLSARR